MSCDDAFFNRNWAGACWDRRADPLALGTALPCKSKKQRGSAGTRSLSLRCLSQFFLVERKEELLRERIGGVSFLSTRLRRAWARVVSFLKSGAISTWPLRAGLVRALSPSNVL